MYRMDAGHTGCYDTVSGGIIPQGNLKWKYKTNGTALSSPAIADNIIYLQSSGDNLYAIDVASGALIWNYTTGKSSVLSMSPSTPSSPAVVNGAVYFGSTDNNIYALDAYTGELKWNYSTSDTVYSSPVIVGGVLYICGGREGYIYALGIKSGSLLWKYQINKLYPDAIGAACSPVYLNKTVYAGSIDGTIYALNSSDGSVIWTFFEEGQNGNVLSADGDTIYFGSQNSHWTSNTTSFVYALNAINGSLKWKKSFKEWIDSSPVISKDLVYISCKDSTISGLNKGNGSVIWEKSSIYARNLALADDILYSGNRDGKLYAFNATDGNSIRIHDTGNKYSLTNNPVIYNGSVFFVVDGGYLCAFD